MQGVFCLHWTRMMMMMINGRSWHSIFKMELECFDQIPKFVCASFVICKGDDACVFVSTELR